jgi:5-oxoprolinase (ATP-hydrolysing)
VSAWRIWVDTGGTFTDCLARDPEGGLHRAKVLSSSCLRLSVAPAGRRRFALTAAPELPAGFLEGARLRRLGASGGGLRIVRHDVLPPFVELEDEPPGEWMEGEVCEVLFDEEAPVLAARLVTGTARRCPLPEHELRLATTRGTNALLERRGGRVALFVTAGFADLLVIGTQQRPELFTLRPDRPPPLYEAVVEVPGRLDATGAELEPLAPEALASEVDRLLAAGIDGAAVALLHAYRTPGHEERLACWLEARGFAHVSRSSALAPRIQLLARGETAVIDAYLWPVIQGYLDAVREQSGASRLLVMTSAGGLVEAGRFRPRDSLLSGPAGGVVGAAAAGRAAGRKAIIAFDMGGTSTDVSRCAGDLDYRFETRIGGARLLAPALRIETVAAGGGSICSFDGSQLKVGPESAGASPGPACYGAGGPLTLTDVNLLLGRLDPDRSGIPLAPEAASRRADELAAAIAAGEPLAWSEDGRGRGPDTSCLAHGEATSRREAFLLGLLRIADERMAEAVRRISVRRGYDPAEHALVAFGGAGPQHACALAELLGIATVLVPPDAGLLSALGLGHARLERFAERQVLRPLEEVEERVPEWLAELAQAARRELASDGAGGPYAVRHLAALRLLGQESTLEVEAGSGAVLELAFRHAYRELYGYEPEGRPVELESLKVVAAAGPEEEPAPPAEAAEHPAEPVATTRVLFEAGWTETSVFERAGLAPGGRIRGPALVFESHCTTVVPPGWGLRVDGSRALVLER